MLADFIFAGAYLALALALGYLVRSFKWHSWCAFLLYFSISYWQFYHGLLIENKLFEWPNLYLTHLPLYLLIWPLLYLFFSLAVFDYKRFKKIHLLHFLPSLFTVFAFLPVYLLGPDMKEEQLLDWFYDESLGWQTYLLPFGPLSAVCYCSILLYKFRLRLKNTQSSRLLVFPILVFSLLAIALTAAFGRLLASEALLIIAYSSITVVVLLMFFISIRYPQLLLDLAVESKKALRKNRPAIYLQESQAKPLKEQLLKLMNEERLFCDEDLTLERLATTLDINRHQLSELLNLHLQKTFSEFVNEKRIELAKELLKTNRKQSILAIGQSVGFNSNSAFHAAFNRFVGVSPGQFRKT